MFKHPHVCLSEGNNLYRQLEAVPHQNFLLVGLTKPKKERHENNSAQTQTLINAFSF